MSFKREKPSQKNCIALNYIFQNFRFQQIFKSTIIAQLILLQIGVIISLFLFTFRLKNPAAFNDDFWCQSINAWILAASFIPQVVFHNLPGSSPKMFHICSGTNPNSDDLKILK